MTQSQPLNCPHCGAVIGLEDVNVSTDVALCRQCQAVHSFAKLRSQHQDDSILDTIPNRVTVTQGINGVELVYKRPKTAGIAIGVFGLGWSSFVGIFATEMFSGESYTINGVEKSGVDTMTLLFLLPFVLVGIGMLCAAVYQLFGAIKLTVRPGHAELFRGIGSIGRRQKFLLSKDKEIAVVDSNISQNHRVLKMIEVEQPEGDSFCFGTALHGEPAQEYFAAVLRSMRV